jgi:DNA-binding Lrp family transcriptional regulator
MLPFFTIPLVNWIVKRKLKNKNDESDKTKSLPKKIAAPSKVSKIPDMSLKTNMHMLTETSNLKSLKKENERLQSQISQKMSSSDLFS